MFGLTVFCVQIFFVQYTFSQSMTSSNMINGNSPSYGQPRLSTASLAAANTNQGLAGQMMANGIPAAAFGQMRTQALGIPENQMGMPTAAAPNNFGYISSYGGSGNGDVAVAGELPVAGTTAITGQVPMSGKVQFTGTLPAGGIVTISGTCGYGMNNGQYNAPIGTKPVYKNNPYSY